MISFLLCIIAALLCALVLAIMEQRGAFSRGYELGQQRGLREGKIIGYDDAKSEFGVPEASYPEMWVSDPSTGGEHVPVKFQPPHAR
jgi:hypothetical protein